MHSTWVKFDTLMKSHTWHLNTIRSWIWDYDTDLSCIIMIRIAWSNAQLDFPILPLGNTGIILTGINFSSIMFQFWSSIQCDSFLPKQLRMIPSPNGRNEMLRLHVLQIKNIYKYFPYMNITILGFLWPRLLQFFSTALKRIRQTPY